jgi:GAF domain-containing protein
LLRNVVNLLKDGFNLYYAAVFLIDENRRYAILEAGTDEAGQRMLEEGHKLIIGGSSMVGWSTANKEPRISQEVEQESIHFQNPHLPLTRSELALPIKIGSQIFGAISIQSIESNAFDEDDIIILQGIADSLAVALENANLFQQFEDSLKEIQHLNRQYIGESWANIIVEGEKELDVTKGSEIADDKDTSEIIIPMTLRSDQVIGNIILETDQTEFSTEEKEFIDAISSQAALALESARLLDEANRRVEREQALRQLTNKFSLTLDFDQLLQSIVRELGQLPLVAEASIHMSAPINNPVPDNGNPPNDIENDFTNIEPSEEKQD